MKYRVLLEQDEDGFFVAAVPALPGCVSQGDTRDEALKNVREAIAGYLESLEGHQVLLSADCFPARESRIAASQRKAWLTHLRQTYPLDECEGYFAAWAGEDVYFALEDELEWLRGADLIPEVMWRKGSFALVAAIRPER